MLINENELQQLRDCIEAVEKNTSAELVTVLAHSSDDYRYIPLLWAAFIAMSVPLVSLWFYPVGLLELCTVQLVTFITMSLLFKIPALQIRMIPKSVRHWRAANMARRQFLENNLHHTKDETGLLIFVSEAERYIEIIADRGISKYIDNSQWKQIVDSFTLQVKNGKTLEGFIECVSSCGELLEIHLPATDDNPNELSNHLVII